MDLRNYMIVTASYWGFTLTDGALRMLVLLYFHDLGYSPVQLAFLFLLYELCGIFTNLLGGWMGSRVGLKVTLFSGLGIQIVALLALSLVQEDWVMAFSVGYVMAAQALSGIAKDLTKMSSKSAVKLLLSDENKGQREVGKLLFRWVAILTGSKNALKGAEPTIASVVPINVYLNDLKTHGNAWDEAKGFEEVVAALPPPPQPACVAGPGGDSRLEGLYHQRGSLNGRPRYCAASGASIEFRESGPALGPAGRGPTEAPREGASGCTFGRPRSKWRAWRPPLLPRATRGPPGGGSWGARSGSKRGGCWNGSRTGA